MTREEKLQRLDELQQKFDRIRDEYTLEQCSHTLTRDVEYRLKSTIIHWAQETGLVDTTCVAQLHVDRCGLELDQIRVTLPDQLIDLVHSLRA